MESSENQEPTSTYMKLEHPNDDHENVMANKESSQIVNQLMREKKALQLMINSLCTLIFILLVSETLNLTLTSLEMIVWGKYNKTLEITSAYSCGPFVICIITMVAYLWMSSAYTYNAKNDQGSLFKLRLRTLDEMRLQVPKKWLTALTIIQVLVSGMLITCQLYILIALPKSPLIHSKLVNELGFIAVPVASILLAIACVCLICVRQKCAINIIAFICAFGSVVVATLLHIGWKNLKYDSITIEDEEHKTLYIALATMILSSPLILLMCYIAIFFITLNMWFSFEMNSSSSNEGQKSKCLLSISPV